MTSPGNGDDIVLTKRERKLLGRWEGYRYFLLLLLLLLFVVAGTGYLLVTARIAARMNTDLPKVIQAWLEKGPSYQESYSGLLIAAFDKWEGALMCYGLFVVFLPVVLLAREERRLFRKLRLLYGRARNG